jgi:hypothetical protein
MAAARRTFWLSLIDDVLEIIAISLLRFVDAADRS